MPSATAALRFIIAPNSLKGSLSALEAADAIEAGIKQSISTAVIIKQPIADGGEYTVDILVKALGGKIEHAMVGDPLGRKIKAKYGLLNSGTGIIEMSAASGITLLKEEEQNPMETSTYGTGELIKILLDKGCREIIVGVGGSATVDAGAGMLQALGIKFAYREGNEISPKGGNLGSIDRIDLSGLDQRLNNCKISVMCDVENKLLGKEGAAPVFAPQKGASKEDVKTLEKCLEHFNNITLKVLGKDMSTLKFGGAAGGIAAAFQTYLNAGLKNGVQYLLKVVGIEKQLEQGGIVITAEGKLDQQTLKGKGPYGIAMLAKKHQLAVICFAGQIDQDMKRTDFKMFDAVIPIANRPMDIQEAKANAGELMQQAAFEATNLIKIGANSKR